MPKPILRLSRERFPGRPAFDTAGSRALMEGVASGRLPETFRLFVPEHILAFGPEDSARPGHREALAAANEGFAPAERPAGRRDTVRRRRHKGHGGIGFGPPGCSRPRSLHPRFTTSCSARR